MIIDMHAHTSNHALWHLHTTSATIKDLQEHAKKHAVAKTVLMATYFPFKGTGLHNIDLIDRIGDHDQFLVFGSLDASRKLHDGLAELQSLLIQKKIVGIKLYPGYQTFCPSNDKMDAIYTLAEEYHIPVMFHCGELHHCCPREKRLIGKDLKCGMTYCPIDELQDLARPHHIGAVAKKFSHVQFIASHLGNPYFDELREVMLLCPNVLTDISGQFISNSEENTDIYKKMITQEIKKFLALPNGIDRVLFGTDFPIQSYEDSIMLIKELALSPDHEEKIFSANAKRVLHLI